MSTRTGDEMADRTERERLVEPAEPTEDDVLAFVDWLEKRPALDDHPLAILEWAWARFQGRGTEQGEPVAWMIHDRGLRHRWTTMADPLTKDDATASLIHAHPDRYTITPLYPGPVQEASGE